jgi:hypothetical protein
MATTLPTDHTLEPTAPAVIIAPYYKDPQTGALYVHGDLKAAADPWAAEDHIGPARVDERFGDVESWANYVLRFGGVAPYLPFLTWNARGFRAVLDYHTSEGPNRAQWVAAHPFEWSREWRKWTQLASGAALAQRALVENIEDLGEDIVEPGAADLAQLLRSLRATVNASASAEIRADGSTSVSYQQDKAVKSGTSNVGVELPPTFVIAIPVLKGHMNGEGRPVRYKLTVRVRASVDDNAHLSFRLSIPNADAVVESVYADRVQTAAGLLPDEFEILRAAD